MSVKKKEIKVVSNPLMSWDISNPRNVVEFRKSGELELLVNLAGVNKWQIDFKQELSVSYQALVLTDLDQKILWASGGFQAMTGYTPSFAKGKKPSFLQGVNTSQTVKSSMREKVAKGMRFSETVTNYRKNGEEYECRISIIPLRNTENVITHFLALESESE